MEQSKEKEWKGTTRGGAFGYRFFILLIRFSGVKAAYAFLFLVVPYFIPFAPKATKAIWKFGRQILKYSRIKTAGLLLKNYYSLGQTLIDKVAIHSGKKEVYQFRFGPEYNKMLELLDRNEGAVIIGAHIGNWETGTPFFDKYGKKMNVVMYDAEYRKIKDILEKETDAKGYKVIPVNDDALVYMMKIRNALADHEYVCFQGDRYLPGMPTIRLPFLGKEASFPAGPFLLASRLKVPVIFYFATREKGMCYTFHFTMAQPVTRNRKEKPEEKLLRQYITTLENLVNQYPEQWFNYYNFWK